MFPSHTSAGSTFHRAVTKSSQQFPHSVLLIPGPWPILVWQPLPSGDQPGLTEWVCFPLKEPLENAVGRLLLESCTLPKSPLESNTWGFRDLQCTYTVHLFQHGTGATAMFSLWCGAAEVGMHMSSHLLCPSFWQFRVSHQNIWFG